MAISAQLEIAQFASNRKWLRTEVPITLNGSGNGSTVVNLNSTFDNPPDMLVVPPLGGDLSYFTGVGVTPDYTAVYEPTTPKITVSVAGESNSQLLNKTVTVFLLAADRI